MDTFLFGLLLISVLKLHAYVFGETGRQTEKRQGIEAPWSLCFWDRPTDRTMDKARYRSSFRMLMFLGQTHRQTGRQSKV